MTPIHVSTSTPLLYHSRHPSEDSEIFFTSSTKIRSRDRIISVIRSYKPQCNGIPLRPLQGILPSTYCYHTFALKTAVRLKFHHMVKFETDTCPRHCYHTSCMTKRHGICGSSPTTNSVDECRPMRMPVLDIIQSSSGQRLITACWEPGNPPMNRKQQYA